MRCLAAISSADRPSRLIVQPGPVQTEQLGLDRQRQLWIVCARSVGNVHLLDRVDARFFLEPGQLGIQPADLGVQFLRLDAHGLLSDLSLSCGHLRTSPGSPSSACAFHLYNWFGWMPYSDAICAIGRSSLSISSTIWAFCLAVYCFLICTVYHLNFAHFFVRIYFTT